VSPAASSDKPTGPFRKPRADVYTVLLTIALIALILGIVCLYFEMDMYNWKFKAGPSVSADPPTAIAMAEPCGPAAVGCSAVPENFQPLIL